MDLRNRNQPTVQGKREPAVQKSSSSRPNTVAAVFQCDNKRPVGLPDGSKSLAKIHPLGTIPKYLRKQKQISASTSSSVPATFSTQPDRVDEPAEPLQSVKPVSDVQLDAEYKQQMIDRLERKVQELLTELGFRERRIQELELSVSSTQQTLCQMQSMMESHLKAQQPVLKRIPKENKILLLLQMILENQTNGRPEARDKDPEHRYA